MCFASSAGSLQPTVITILATTSRCAVAVAVGATVFTLPPYGISRTDASGALYDLSVRCW
ncbi:MAG: hypothetical protein QOH50_819 [Kribbellaceae bacterium]|jgi:hypothetical protein|nr:hypothetical protein [Kribbellaceae bacterium]